MPVFKTIGLTFLSSACVLLTLPLAFAHLVMGAARELLERLICGLWSWVDKV